MFFVCCVRLIHSPCLFFLIPIIREKRQEGFDKVKSLRGRDGDVGEGRDPPPSKGNTGRLNFIALSCMNRNRYEAEPGYGETRYDANRARLKRQPKKTKQAKGKL